MRNRVAFAGTNLKTWQDRKKQVFLTAKIQSLKKLTRRFIIMFRKRKNSQKNKPWRLCWRCGIWVPASSGPNMILWTSAQRCFQNRNMISSQKCPLFISSHKPRINRSIAGDVILATGLSECQSWPCITQVKYNPNWFSSFFANSDSCLSRGNKSAIYYQSCILSATHASICRYLYH